MPIQPAQRDDHVEPVNHLFSLGLTQLSIQDGR
jgi:hypothetical protein